jgi:hypothetical protein
MSNNTGKRNVYKETRDELRAKTDSMPDVLRAEGEYRPQFSALEMQNIQDILMGREATRHDPGRKGLLELEREQDPTTATLWDNLKTTAADDLALGADMDPALMRVAQQSIRGRTLNTLGSKGPAGNYQEALGISEFAQKLRNERRAFATGIAGLSDARNQNTLDRVAGISQSAQPRLFGSSLNVNDIFQNNANAANAKANNTAALAGGGTAAAGAIIAALV